MNDLSTIERLLKEILDELQSINKKLSTPAIPPPTTAPYRPPGTPFPSGPPVPNGGYTCVCGVWVQYGTMHSCGRIRYTFGTGGSTVSQCGASGLGGTCYLNKGHSGCCLFARVYNIKT